MAFRTLDDELIDEGFMQVVCLWERLADVSKLLNTPYAEDMLAFLVGTGPNR